MLGFWDKENVMLLEHSKARGSDLKELYWRILGSGLEGTSEYHLACQGERKREIFTRASSPSKGFTECQHKWRTPPGTLQSESLTRDWWVVPASVSSSLISFQSHSNQLQWQKTTPKPHTSIHRWIQRWAKPHFLQGVAKEELYMMGGTKLQIHQD